MINLCCWLSYDTLTVTANIYQVLLENNSILFLPRTILEGKNKTYFTYIVDLCVCMLSLPCCVKDSCGIEDCVARKKIIFLLANKFARKFDRTFRTHLSFVNPPKESSYCYFVLVRSHYLIILTITAHLVEHASC